MRRLLYQQLWRSSMELHGSWLIIHSCQLPRLYHLSGNSVSSTYHRAQFLYCKLTIHYGVRKRKQSYHLEARRLGHLLACSGLIYPVVSSKASPLPRSMTFAPFYLFYWIKLYGIGVTSSGTTFTSDFMKSINRFKSWNGDTKKQHGHLINYRLKRRCNSNIS
jgi:hypothetical protein